VTPRLFPRRLLLLTIIAAVVLPLLPLVLWSVSRSWFFPDVLPGAWSGRAWSYVVDPTTRVLPALWNSVRVALAVTALAALIGVPAGRALGLYRFRGRRLAQLLILTPALMPIIAVAMGIHVAFIRLGLTERLVGVILVHLIPVLPYMILITGSIFANFNVDYEAQARTLGAGGWRLVWYVTLPLIAPGLLVGALFAFIISWSQYLLTLLIGGGQVITLPVLLFSFATSGDNAVTGALSLVLVVPSLIFVWLTGRYLSGPAAMSGFARL
jgi:putative spermidine/putrescine transport system permease protein